MKIAFLTAGGIAPCLSSSMARMIKQYSLINSNIEIIGYLNGYKGLLEGNSIDIPIEVAKYENLIYSFGGTFLGNSRVKLTNVDDCIDKGYIDSGQDPLEVAANQLIKDNVNILHTIGGDDTNITAADLVKYLNEKKYNLTVVGLPKTIDNDVYPLSQTLGAFTAAEQSAIFFENIVNENTTSSRQLIIHEVMGRNCGWLTAYSAYLYRKKLYKKEFIPDIGLVRKKWDIHAIYIPESNFDLLKEIDRLNYIMDKIDCVNIFLSEGAGIDNIIKQKKEKNEDILCDAFGHYRLDDINPGKWYANYFKNKIQCDKVLVQKSGYFSRSAPPNQKDLELIIQHADMAVDCAINGTSGVVGIDDRTNRLACIKFERIKGGKPFDVSNVWFVKMLENIGQK